MENKIYCDKHLKQALMLKELAGKEVIVDFPLCKDCDELRFGKVIYEDYSCWNDKPEDCCKK